MELLEARTMSNWYRLVCRSSTVERTRAPQFESDLRLQV